MRRAARQVAIVASLTGAFACGGADAGTGPGTSGTPGTTTSLPNGTMTATIDGAPWRASFFLSSTVQNGGTAGPSIVQITGVDTVGGPLSRARQITVTMARLTPPATGTFPLDFGSLNATLGYNANGNLNQGGVVWSSWTNAPGKPSGGTFTVTLLTSTRIAGTFSFTAGGAATNPSGSTPSVAVTNGTFDIGIGNSP